MLCRCKMVLGVLCLVPFGIYSGSGTRMAWAGGIGFGTPVDLGLTINSASDEGHPDISADGLTFYFNSNRAGGVGGYDLWQSTRASLTSPWTTSANLGSTVNSASLDRAQASHLTG